MAPAPLNGSSALEWLQRRTPASKRELRSGMTSWIASPPPREAALGAIHPPCGKGLKWRVRGGAGPAAGGARGAKPPRRVRACPPRIEFDLVAHRSISVPASIFLVRMLPSIRTPSNSPSFRRTRACAVRRPRAPSCADTSKTSLSSTSSRRTPRSCARSAPRSPSRTRRWRASRRGRCAQALWFLDRTQPCEI
jgi:hypothetical protein